MIDPAPFGLFVRSVPGKVVPRYGQHGHYVGAHRSTDAGKGWAWTDKIQALGKAEAARYRVEYQRAIRSGALVKCSADDYALSQQPATQATDPDPSKD